MDYDREREAMTAEQLVRHGIVDPRVLDAMRSVPRERFVDEILRRRAYEDGPLDIGHGQTISQPYMVARMSEVLALSAGERVLEVGTGSGYQTAVLARMGAEVFTIERIEALSERASATLEGLGYTGIRFRVGDGCDGWEEAAPFDAILVAAGASSVPPALMRQLREGGRMTIPVGERRSQTLIKIVKRGVAFEREEVCRCVFVPLVGACPDGV